MKLLLSLSALLLATTLSALRTDIPNALISDGPLDIIPHPWIGNGKGKSRAPCPFLNTAANHGILPYDGKFIPFDWFAKLVKKVGVPDDLAKGLFAKFDSIIAYIRANGSPNHPLDAISLVDLGIHGQMEHDVSLSRWDTLSPQQPGDTRRSEDLVNGLLSIARANATMVSDDSQLFLSHPDVAAWRRERYDQENQKYNLADAHAKVVHRKVEYGLQAQFIGAGECMLLLHILGKDGKISVADAESILLNERFPKGWLPPQQELGKLELIGGLSKCALEYHTPNGILSWLAGNHLMDKGLSWAHGLTEECPMCEENNMMIM